MKIVTIDTNNKARLNKILEWFIYMAGYTISFILILTDKDYSQFHHHLISKHQNEC